jgi:hypothetical protein
MFVMEGLSGGFASPAELNFFLEGVEHFKT